MEAFKNVIYKVRLPWRKHRFPLFGSLSKHITLFFHQHFELLNEMLENVVTLSAKNILIQKRADCLAENL